MLIPFQKFQGTGNDFIIVDNRLLQFNLGPKQIERLCNRHFGIGGDGFILIEPSVAAGFKMNYFNADGHKSSMCGNGARCAVVQAISLGMVGNQGTFEAYDGIHSFEWLEQKQQVRISMSNVDEIQQIGDFFFVNTGSPHIVVPVKDLSVINVFEEGKKIRQSPAFAERGVNVNFVQYESGRLNIRTYERGVEDETLSCGTGCVAAAIWLADQDTPSSLPVQSSFKIQTLGGDLEILLEHFPGNRYRHLYLQGPAIKVFEGVIEL